MASSLKLNEFCVNLLLRWRSAARGRPTPGPLLPVLRARRAASLPTRRAHRTGNTLHTGPVLILQNGFIFHLVQKQFKRRRMCFATTISFATPPAAQITHSTHFVDLTRFVSACSRALVKVSTVFYTNTLCNTSNGKGRRRNWAKHMLTGRQDQSGAM